MKGEIYMIPCIITGAICVLVSGAIGVAVMALLSFHKLTEYEEEILELRRRVAELEEIDADEIEKCVHEWYDVGEYVFADTIRNADTIIEAEVSE